MKIGAATFIGGVLLAACTAGGSIGTTSTSSTTTQPVISTTVPLSAGTTRIDERGVDQVWVPAGTFVMGSSDAEVAAVNGSEPPGWVSRELHWEQPAHQVTISLGFWIDEHEVTNAEFQAFVDAGGYENQSYWSDEGWTWLEGRRDGWRPSGCGREAIDEPRTCVTWFEAQAYAAWRGGSLPTEAQWEFAARGPESRIYPWGDEFEASRANVVDTTSIAAVGSYPSGSSWVGAVDMAGNAMEWVADWLGPYGEGPETDPRGADTGNVKVEKGGWWGSNPFVARSAYRHYEDPPDYQDHHIGFRVVTGDGGGFNPM